MLDGYEAVLETLVIEGWPSEKSVYDHAAYLLLRWHSQHKEEFTIHKMDNPGTTGQPMPI